MRRAGIQVSRDTGRVELGETEAEQPHERTRALQIGIIGCVLVSGAGVRAGPGQVQRHVGLVTDDPAVVAGRDGEEVARTQEPFGSIGHPHGRFPAEDEPNVVDLTQRRPRDRAHMLGPPPPGLVHGPAKLLAANTDRSNRP